MKIVLSVLKPFLVYMLLALGTYLMLRLTIDYSSFRTDIHFLRVKQDYLDNKVWLTAFYVHVFSSILALMAGFTQFSKYILKKHRPLHRVVGRVYAVVILLINFPAGMIMAVYANGEWPSKLAFVILDILWFWFTLRAVQAARGGRIDEHRRFMIRSFALTFSAITLRAWKLVLVPAFHPDPLTLYMIQAWIGFVPNLLFAEWIIRRKRSSPPLEVHNDQNKYANNNDQRSDKSKDGPEPAV